MKNISKVFSLYKVSNLWIWTKDNLKIILSKSIGLIEITMLKTVVDKNNVSLVFDILTMQCIETPVRYFQLEQKQL